MALRVIRQIYLILLFFSFSAYYGQTLYWIGGSGNFNDPKHWSLSSGGPSALKSPDQKTDVIFDFNSGNNYEITFLFLLLLLFWLFREVLTRVK